jgi:hypothetical protein
LSVSVLVVPPDGIESTPHPNLHVRFTEVSPPIEASIWIVTEFNVPRLLSNWLNVTADGGTPDAGPKL